MNTLKKTILVALLVSTTSAHAGMFGAVVSVLIGKTLGKTVSNISEKQQPISESELAGVADKTNKLLPRAIDEDTRLDNVTSGPGRRLTNYYTIVTDSSRNIDKTSFLKYIQSRLTSEACLHPSWQYVLKDGVTLGYSYRGSDGGFIAEFDVNAKDCGYAN